MILKIVLFVIQKNILETKQISYHLKNLFKNILKMLMTLGIELIFWMLKLKKLNRFNKL